MFIFNKNVGERKYIKLVEKSRINYVSTWRGKSKNFSLKKLGLFYRTVTIDEIKFSDCRMKREAGGPLTASEDKRARYEAGLDLNVNREEDYSIVLMVNPVC